MYNTYKYYILTIRYILLSISIIFVLSYIITSIIRIMYPYAISNVEGVSYQALYALTNGYSLYGEPNIHYISIVYTPLYYILSFMISLITGFGYIPLRLLSFLSSIGIYLLILLFVHKETRDKYLSFITASFYLLIYPLFGSWLDLAKPDTLMLLFLLISFYIIRYSNNYILLILSGLLIATAYFTKQEALSICLLILIYLLIRNIKKGLLIIIPCIITMSMIHLILNNYTNGWFAYYTFTLPSYIAYATIMYNKILYFIIKDNLSLFPVNIAFVVIYVLIYLRKNSDEQPLFYLILLISFMIGIIPTRVIFGGGLNSLMPYYIILIIMFGISTGKILVLSQENESLNKILTPLIYTLLAVQFIMQIYNPIGYIPDKDQAKLNNETIKTIGSYKGEVFVENFGQLAVMAGKQNTPHFGTIDDILIGDHGAIREGIKDKFKHAFAEKYYSAVFLEELWLNYDFNNEIKAELEKNYIEIGKDPSGRFTVFEAR
jgi:hypothetical protein